MAVRGGATPPPPGVNGEFVPCLLPEGLFDDDQPEERWAVHPGFAPTQLLVSNLGAVRTSDRTCAKGVYYKDYGALAASGYRRKCIAKKKYQVHILVCQAWHGPKPPRGSYTVDHITKHDGDFERERSDNRASNLRWATPREQAANQRARQANSTSVPIYGRPVSSSDDDEWVWYASAQAASRELSVNAGNISATCNGKYTQAAGYVFRYVPPEETQENLPPVSGKDPNEEEWRLVPGSNNRLRVSSRGRVQTLNPRGGKFGPKRTPKPTQGEPYVYVYYKGQAKGLHAVVWKTFRPDNLPSGNETIDHKDQDKTNNALWNLCCLDPSGQNLNQTRPPAEEMAVTRKRVIGWVDGGNADQGEHFGSTLQAEHSLNARFKTTKFDHGNISQSARTGCVHNGWRFTYDGASDDKVKSEEQRVRVLAAIAALPVA